MYCHEVYGVLSLDDIISDTPRQTSFHKHTYIHTHTQTHTHTHTHTHIHTQNNTPHTHTHADGQPLHTLREGASRMLECVCVRAFVCVCEFMNYRGLIVF